jgi:hypothetical protein
VILFQTSLTISTCAATSRDALGSTPMGMCAEAATGGGGVQFALPTLHSRVKEYGCRTASRLGRVARVHAAERAGVTVLFDDDTTKNFTPQEFHRRLFDYAITGARVPRRGITIERPLSGPSNFNFPRTYPERTPLALYAIVPANLVPTHAGFVYFV